MERVLPILIVSGEPEHRDKLAASISNCGLRVIPCGTFAAAKELLKRVRFSLVVCEDTLPDGNFRAVTEVAGISAQTLVIVVSRKDDWDSCLSAIGAGAFDNVAFPPYPGELERAVCAALGDCGQSRKFALKKAA